MTAVIVFIVATEAQMIMLAKASLVIDDREAGNRLMSYVESMC